MKGVYEVPTSSRNYKKYIKYGAEQEAIDDFWSAKPAYHKSITTRAGVIIFTTIHMKKGLASLTFYEDKI